MANEIEHVDSTYVFHFEIVMPEKKRTRVEVRVQGCPGAYKAFFTMWGMEYREIEVDRAFAPTEVSALSILEDGLDDLINDAQHMISMIALDLGGK